MSGNAQTEVIAGPAAIHVIGLKTFQTISSITPSADTSGSITLGFSGAGITTTGVTGSATLDGVGMSADILNNTFTITSGNAAGLKVNTLVLVQMQLFIMVEPYRKINNLFDRYVEHFKWAINNKRNNNKQRSYRSICLINRS